MGIIVAANNFGLFNGNSTKGYWLEKMRKLEYYDLESEAILYYKKKVRILCVKTLDYCRRTLIVDVSKTVIELVKVFCTKIGKYGFVKGLSSRRRRREGMQGL